MKVYRSLESYEQGEKTVATIGTFDGVHIGHKTILERLKRSAKEIGGETVLISFHPHPRLVLFPENNPLKLLQSLEEKIETLEAYGLDKLLLIPFTKEFSRTSSKVFIKEILAEKIGIKKIIIGYDHHFGKNRTGGIEELEVYAKELGYSVEEIPAQQIDKASISSTKVRKALQEGKVSLASSYLGYDYPFSGKVVHGEKQGRKLGYPTANMEPIEPLKLIPKDGVYVVRVKVPSLTSDQIWDTHHGMMSIGKKPTMGEFKRAQEVYIFDFDRDIYGKTIRVEFLKWLRPQQKFEGIEALIAAIDADRDTSLAWIKEWEQKP